MEMLTVWTPAVNAAVAIFSSCVILYHNLP